MHFTPGSHAMLNHLASFAPLPTVEPNFLLLQLRPLSVSEHCMQCPIHWPLEKPMAPMHMAGMDRAQDHQLTDQAPDRPWCLKWRCLEACLPTAFGGYNI